MSSSFSRIWIHAMWTTKNQSPLIQTSFRPKLNEIIAIQFQEMGCHLEAISAMSDHIHCLFLQNKSKNTAEIIKTVKGNSSHLINFGNLLPEKFSWQKGYAAFAVSHTEIETSIKLFADQDLIHCNSTYNQELEKILIINGLEKDLQDSLSYKERYRLRFNTIPNYKKDHFISKSTSRT